MVSPNAELKQAGEVGVQSSDNVHSAFSRASQAAISVSARMQKVRMKDFTISNSSSMSKDCCIGNQVFKTKISLGDSTDHSEEGIFDQSLSDDSITSADQDTRSDSVKSPVANFPTSNDVILNDVQSFLRKSGFAMPPTLDRLLGNESRMSLPLLSRPNTSGVFGDFTAAGSREVQWTSSGSTVAAMKSPVFSMADISVVVPPNITLDEPEEEKPVESGDDTQLETIDIHQGEDGLSDCQPADMTHSHDSQSDNVITIKESRADLKLSASDCDKAQTSVVVTSTDGNDLNDDSSSREYVPEDPQLVENAECIASDELEKKTTENRSDVGSVSGASKASDTEIVLTRRDVVEFASSPTESCGSSHTEDYAQADWWDESAVDDASEWQKVGGARSKMKQLKRKLNRTQVQNRQQENPQRFVKQNTYAARRDVDKTASNHKPTQTSTYTAQGAFQNRFARLKARQQHKAGHHSSNSSLVCSSIAEKPVQTNAVWSKPSVTAQISTKDNVSSLDRKKKGVPQVPTDHLHSETTSITKSEYPKEGRPRKFEKLPKNVKMKDRRRRASSRENVMNGAIPSSSEGANALPGPPPIVDRKVVRAADNGFPRTVESTRNMEQRLHSLSFGTVVNPRPKLEGEELKAQLKHQLEYYFSSDNLAQDTYLISQMNEEHWVPIWTIANFKAVRRLTPDFKLVVEVLRESHLVEVDDTGEKVRPNESTCEFIKKEATEESQEDRPHPDVAAVIIREIADGVPKEEIVALFDEAPVELLNCYYAGNGSWYAVFEKEKAVHAAYKHLREKVCFFKGKPLHARVKGTLHHLDAFNSKPAPAAKATSAESVITTTQVVQQVTSPPVDYVPPFLLCPPPAQFAPGTGHIPAPVAAPVPPFIPRVATATTSPAVSTAPDPAQAVAVTPQFSSFVVSPQGWPHAGLYPPDAAVMRQQFATPFLQPTYKPSVVPQFQQQADPTKASNAPSHRYSEYHENAAHKNAFNHPKVTAAPYVHHHQQQLVNGVPSTSQPQPYYVLTDPSTTPLLHEAVPYMPQDQQPQFVSPSLPNAPVHYLPAVNGAFVTRAPFVTPNANDQTIMIATPQHVNMMAPTPHFRPPAKRIDSGPHSVSEQSHSGASNQRARYSTSRASAGSYQPEPSPRLVPKGQGVVSNGYTATYQQRSASRDGTTTNIHYANKAPASGFNAPDQRDKAITGNESYPADQSRIPAGNDFYVSASNSDTYSQAKRNSTVRRYIPGPGNNMPVANDQRNVHQVGFDRRLARQRRGVRRPEDEISPRVPSYSMATSTFSLESQAFPPLPGAPEGATIPSSHHQPTDSRPVVADVVKGLSVEGPKAGDGSISFVGAKKYSEVSNIGTVVSGPKPNQHVPDLNKTARNNVPKTASAVLTQPVADKNPPIAHRNSKHSPPADKTNNDVAKPTQIRPTEQRNDVNSVKKQIPKEPVKEPKEASCSPKVNGTTNDKPAPTEQDKEMPQEVIEHEVEDGGDRKLTYAEMLLKVNNASQMNGKEASDSGRSESGEDAHSGDETKDSEEKGPRETDDSSKQRRSNEETPPSKPDRRDGAMSGSYRRSYEGRRGGGWQPRHYQDNDFRRPRRDWGYNGDRRDGPRDFRGRGGYRGRRTFRDNRYHNNQRPVSSNGTVNSER